VTQRVMNVLLRCGPARFVLENHDVARSVFDNRRIDYAEALVVEKPRWRECTKVFRRSDIDPMVASVIPTLVRVRKSAGDCRGPEQNILALFRIKEEFRRPNV